MSDERAKVCITIGVVFAVEDCTRTYYTDVIYNADRPPWKMECFSSALSGAYDFFLEEGRINLASEDGRYVVVTVDDENIDNTLDAMLQAVYVEHIESLNGEDD